MLHRLSDLYATMDRLYAEAASHYGFQCTGCRDNCCQTRFYHHTVIEYLYLMKGVDQLPPDTRDAARQIAGRVVEGTRLADQSSQKHRFMCPLNRAQRCIIYPFRPMICRLHGISHELRRNDGTLLIGEGCQRFDDQALGKPYFRFDRTHFYRQMVLLEKDVRATSGITRKLKMTIAEMLIAEDLAAHCLVP
ncbi:MAG: hypothetical protein V2B19_31290 [Pseudomonadota bacterium]